MNRTVSAFAPKRFSSRVILPGILIAACLIPAQVPIAAAAEIPGNVTAESVKIGPGIRDQLAATGSANVMIALAEPASARAAGLNAVAPTGFVRLDITAMKNEIALMQSDVLSQIERYGYQARHTYSAVPALAGKVTSAEALDMLAGHPSVVRIDLDVGGTGHLASSVPVIAADLRHAMGNTGNGIVVAVLDSGLDTDHSNLADNLINEACFADNDGAIDGAGQCPNGSDRQLGAGAAEDDAGHGSHVTGIITSNGTFGSIGAAPDANIVAVKVTWGPSFSGAFSFFSEIVAGLNYIINNPQLGVQVINMSIGTNALFTGNCDASTAFNMAGAAAINTLRANGVITFVSAGNNGSSTQMTSPACLSNVISVGSANDTDVPAGTTNSNATTDVFGPGVGVVSSNLANGTTSASGTSMASPHAAACAALLIESGEATTPNQIETRLETSAFTVTVAASGLTFPRIDCAPLANVPPVCDANGPYTAECGATVTLDGTGSSDANNDPLTYLWEGAIIGGSAVGLTPMVVFESPTGAKTITLTVNDGTDTAQCSSPVTVQDTLAPSITAPDDVTEECADPAGTSVAIGSAIASDSCDVNPTVTNDAPLLFPAGDTTVTWVATDAGGIQVSDSQTVTIEDTMPPTVMCNNPATFVPPDAPISFTATATDQCQGPITPEITEYDCFNFTKKGKRIDKTGSCEVTINGDQITIVDSGGVGDNITWTTSATDTAGNTTTETCALAVINPGKNK